MLQALEDIVCQMNATSSWERSYPGTGKPKRQVLHLLQAGSHCKLHPGGTALQTAEPIHAATVLLLQHLEHSGQEKRWRRQWQATLQKHEQEKKSRNRRRKQELKLTASGLLSGRFALSCLQIESSKDRTQHACKTHTPRHQFQDLSELIS